MKNRSGEPKNGLNVGIIRQKRQARRERNSGIWGQIGGRALVVEFLRFFYQIFVGQVGICIDKDARTVSDEFVASRRLDVAHSAPCVERRAQVVKLVRASEDLVECFPNALHAFRLRRQLVAELGEHGRYRYTLIFRLAVFPFAVARNDHAVPYLYRFVFVGTQARIQRDSEPCSERRLALGEQSFFFFERKRFAVFAFVPVVNDDIERIMAYQVMPYCYFKCAVQQRKDFFERSSFACVGDLVHKLLAKLRRYVFNAHASEERYYIFVQSQVVFL